MMTFRRRIGICSIESNRQRETRAALEDDFHHFRVRVVHADGRLRGIEGWAVRHPYSTCPLAAARLRQLIDTPLNTVANSVMRATDPRQQCTHQLDLAGLAIAAAARAPAQRWYDISIPRHVDGHTLATLERNSDRVLQWNVSNTTIIGPAPYEGISLREGMAAWALANLTEEQAEAALALRRCALISLGRTKDLDAQVHAEPTGRCFVQQPQRAAEGLRMVGSMLDFTASADALCATDRDWLAFRDDTAQRASE